MRNLCTCIVLTTLLTLSSSLRAEREFAHPDRIRYDGQCITIDGKDLFVFSGAFHYFRCPKELWRDRFTKIKQAGFNTVETYVAWNWHEREMPADVNDFSKLDMTDCADWLKMAIDEFGFYVIIRPGPYICAEWADGGYPTWLMTKRPASFGPEGMWYRSNDPTYLEWCKHWYDACCKVIAPQQITRKEPGKPGVILFQIENEYDYAPRPTINEQMRVGQLKALYKDARDNGIDIPIFTCWTRQIRGSKDEDLKNVFDAANSYERWNIQGVAQKVDQLHRDQPDAPAMISELQGGWFASVGGQLSENQEGVTASQCNAITLMAISHGATALNYYMLFGGTNLGDWGARNQTTTYDYAAPIRECGGVDAKYAAVYGIAHMLREYGPALTRAKSIDCKAEQADPNLVITARRATDGQTFVFLWNRSRGEARKGETNVKLASDPNPLKIAYELEPFGFKVLVLPKDASDASKGRWMPEPMPPIDRPQVPGSIKISRAMVAPDPVPTSWQDLKDGESLPASGVLDSRYVYYRATASLNDEQAKNYRTLRFGENSPDPVIVRINGKLVSGGNEFGLHEVNVNLGDSIHAGDNDILVLYENLGYDNGGSTMENAAGLLNGDLIYRKTPDVSLTAWKSKLLEGQGYQRAQPGDMINADYDDSSWESFVLDAKTAQRFADPIQPGSIVTNAAGHVLAYHIGSAVFRASIDVTDDMIKAGLTQLYFGRIDDRGTIYINGTEAGRARSWNDPVFVDGSKLLKPGKNVVAVVVTNRDGAGGLLRPVKLISSTVDKIPLKMQFTKNLGGVERGWQNAELSNAGDWMATSLNGSSPSESSSSSGSLVNWYKVEFELPQREPNAWIPWLARISASGNGMIYLNGHHLGRWWEIGPQREFYLPECWLNFGPGQKNTLTFSLRKTDRGAELRSVEITPDANHAERR